MFSGCPSVCMSVHPVLVNALSQEISSNLEQMSTWESRTNWLDVDGRRSKVKGQYLKNTLRDVLQICHKRPLRPKLDELMWPVLMNIISQCVMSLNRHACELKPYLCAEAYSCMVVIVVLTVSSTLRLQKAHKCNTLYVTCTLCNSGFSVHSV